MSSPILDNCPQAHLQALADLDARMGELLRQRNELDRRLTPLRHAWQREALHQAAVQVRDEHPEAAFVSYFYEDGTWIFWSVLDVDGMCLALISDSLQDAFPLIDTDTATEDLVTDERPPHDLVERADHRFYSIGRILDAAVNLPA